MIVEPDITYDPNIVTEGNIRAYTPSLPTLFKESALYAFRTTWWQESLDELEFNLANEGNTFTKEEYDNSPFQRSGIQHFEGMTEEQARILAENFDRNQYYGQLTKNVSFFNPGMFGGLVAGSIVDPLNFIPYYGIAKLAVKAKSTYKRLKQANNAIRSKPAQGPLGQNIISVVDPMIGAGVANYVVKDKRAKFQEQHDLRMVLADIAIGAGIGGSIVGVRTLRNRMNRASTETHMNRLAQALDQLEEGKPIDLKPHPTKGLNYEKFEQPTTLSESTRATVNAAIKVDDDMFLEILDLGITGDGALTPNEALAEILEKAEAEGYSGVAIPEEFLRNNENLFSDVFLSKYSMEVKNIDGGNGKQVVVIKDIQNQELRWDTVDPNEKFEYVEQDGQAQTLQQRIAEGVLAFTSLPQKALKRLKDIETKAKQANEKLNVMKNAVRDAGRCVISNG